MLSTNQSFAAVPWKKPPVVCQLIVRTPANACGGRTRNGYPGRFGSMLDIGAGDGNVTQQLAALVSGPVFATEYSAVMQMRLQMKGYTVLPVEGWHAAGKGPFDLISCLNVLDRADKPMTLLRQMRDCLSPDGRIIIAVVLPFCPFVEVGSRQLKPTERIDAGGRRVPAEVSINRFVYEVFKPLGLEVEAFSRAPYLCEGDVSTAKHHRDHKRMLWRQFHPLRAIPVVGWHTRTHRPRLDPLVVLAVFRLLQMVQPYYLLHDYMFCLSKAPQDSSCPPVGKSSSKFFL